MTLNTRHFTYSFFKEQIFRSVPYSLVNFCLWNSRASFKIFYLFIDIFIFKAFTSVTIVIDRFAD